MADYLHGVYGSTKTVGSRVSTKSHSAIVYIGTAPVHLVEGGADRVNKPVLVNNIAEARKLFGYSEDFAKYTLCEAMNVHLNLNAVGPLIFINVLGTGEAFQASADGSKTATPANGRVVLTSMDDCILSTIKVTKAGSTIVSADQYSVSYSIDKKSVTIQEKTAGALGTAQLTVSYKKIDPSKVTSETVIGSSDGYGLNTGIAALANVYQETGYIPAYVAAPGWSGVPAIHAALVTACRKINGHWDAYLLADIPLSHNSTAITLATAASWKASNGYNNENETVYFPMAQGADGKKYHLSTLAAANLQKLLAEQDGIPYKTASNTDCGIIENLYLGEDAGGRVFDDATINAALNQNGIASAAFVGGKWVIWGAHSADYTADGGDSVNVSETNRMMLYYISNDFQIRRSADVDKPVTANDLASIIAEEQARLDALKQIGAILYGECHLNAELSDTSDIVMGNFSLVFNVTTTPLAKSLTAVVNWTEDGFESYYESFQD